ncbi:MAG: response regulator [Geminicoccaceae bacterium]
MRVLLVDDSVHDRRAIRRLIRRSSMNVSIEEAVDVSSALQLLSVETFDCLLVDYQLPDGNGIELLQKFKTTSVGGPIPAIMLSEHPTDDLVRSAMQNGLLDFLCKEGLNADMRERALRNAVIKNETRSFQREKTPEFRNPTPGKEPFTTIVSAARTLYASEAIQAAISLDASAKKALDTIYATVNS